MALAKETKEHLAKVADSAATLQLAAEEAARRLTEGAVSNATDHVVLRVATRLESRQSAASAAASAIREAQERLQDDFTAAMLEARSIARELAVQQLAVEAEPIITAGYGLSLTPSLSPAEVEAMWAHHAGTGMARAFGSATISETMAWQGSSATPAALPKRLKRAHQKVDAERKKHAVTQSVQAFNEAKREHWGRLKEEGRAKGLPPIGVSPGAGKSGKGDGGWLDATREIWSALLDGKTCPICWKLDGTMVEVGKPFPEGARTPLHGHCRCTVVTAFIPSELERFLPGAEQDYDALKEDIRDYMGSRKFDVGEGVRHAKRYVDEVLERRGQSPIVLAERFNNRAAYFPNIVQARAPSLRW